MSSPAVTPVASPSADLADLAGAVRLSAGGRLPTIASSRPELTPRLAPGKSADQLPELLAALHSLCSQAHRLTARRAVAAARDRLADLDRSAEAQALRLATARDQLLRIVHDWPRQLPGATPPGLSDAARDAASALLLRACPLWRNEWTAEERLADLPDWLAHALLGRPVAQWLEAHEADPQHWAMTWARDQAAAAKPPLMARLLASQLDGPAPADALFAPAATPALLASDDAAGQAQLRRLGTSLATESGFWAAPHLNGDIPDTGPWSRHRGAQGNIDSAWARLVARAADLLRLAGPEGGQWLNCGALALSPGEGIAWTEMARGLLIHWVKLDAAGQTVEACRVLAPTEWNFHPRGVLAQGLAGLSARPADERRLAAQRLAVAFDPCVAFSIADSLDAAEEGSPHA